MVNTALPVQHEISVTSDRVTQSKPGQTACLQQGVLLLPVR